MVLILSVYRIVQEVHQVLEGRQFVDYEDLGKLQYLGQALKESLRLHPPIPGFTRFTHKDIELGGYHIPAGTGIVLSEYVTQRSEDVWFNPDLFNPDRFSPSQPTISGDTYFPFSIGPRTCIGKTLAQFESKVIMARLYQEFELILSSPELPMEYEETLTSRPKNGVWCKVKRRLKTN
jgi:cholesterol 24(S)-hydroxylase